MESDPRRPGSCPASRRSLRLHLLCAPARPENSRRFLKRNRPFPEAGSRPSRQTGRCASGVVSASSCSSLCLNPTRNGGERKWPCCATTGAAVSASTPRPTPTVRGTRRRPSLPGPPHPGGRPWPKGDPGVRPRAVAALPPSGSLRAALSALLPVRGAARQRHPTLSLQPRGPTDPRSRPPRVSRWSARSRIRVQFRTSLSPRPHPCLWGSQS